MKLLQGLSDKRVRFGGVAYVLLARAHNTEQKDFVFYIIVTDNLAFVQY